MILALPVSQPFRRRHSRRRSGPAARWIAPSTPPPPRREVLAAFTMLDTESVVMSVRIRDILALMVCEGGCWEAEEEEGAG